MNAAPGHTQTHHLLHPHLLCIAQVTQRMTTTKAEHLVDRLRLQTTGAVNLPGMNRHQIDEEGKGVLPDLLQYDLIDDLVLVTGTKIGIETGTGHGSIQEETDQDLDQGEGLVQEIEGAVVVEIEVEIDTDIEKAVDIIEHHRMNLMLLKIMQIRL